MFLIVVVLQLRDCQILTSWLGISLTKTISTLVASVHVLLYKGIWMLVNQEKSTAIKQCLADMWLYSWQALTTLLCVRLKCMDKVRKASFQIFRFFVSWSFGIRLMCLPGIFAKLPIWWWQCCQLHLLIFAAFSNFKTCHDYYVMESVGVLRQKILSRLFPSQKS